MNSLSIDKGRFEKEGFLLIKDVLKPEEVTSLREAAYRVIAEDQKKGTYFIHRFAKNHLGCLTEIPEFKNLILDERVVEIAAKLLGGNPIFFGDGIFEIGIGNRGFHKDNPGIQSMDHPDWQGVYPIVRVAFYLQDHKEHSGGLKVRIGSHNTNSTTEGKPYIIPSEERDAVCFCLRTSHAGNAVRLKLAPALSLHNRIEKRVPSFMKLPEEKERISIFLTYGLRSEHLTRYMDYLCDHKVYKNRISACNYSEDLKRELASRIDFIDIKEYSAQLKQRSLVNA